MEERAQALEQGIRENLEKLNLSWTSNRTGSVLCFFFTDQEVNSYKKAMTADTALYSKYFAAMLKRGIYLAPSQFEVSFVSAAHSDNDIAKTVAAHYESLKEIS